MKTSEITVDSDDDPALYYRYDGVDEYGQHYLERIEYDEDGDEVYTEEYIPIAFWNRRAPEPMTSLVRWVSWNRSDYDADTLPDSGQTVVVKLSGRDISGPATLEYDGIDKTFYWAFKEKYGDMAATAGDLWAYLPTPPEGIE